MFSRVSSALKAKYMEKVKGLLCSDGLFKKVSWMMGAEGLARVSRLLTILILGVYFSPTEYGVYILAIAVHELFRVFTRIGTGAKIIQCEQSELRLIVGNALVLQWIVCIAVASAQFAFAEVIAQYYEANELIFALKIMALTHLMYPFVSARVFLVQRNNNMKYFATASGVSVLVENLATAIFALLGMGIVAVAFAKICSAVCWVALFSRARVENFAPKFDRVIFKGLVTFSATVLFSEVLKTLRFQIDTLLAARLLPPELFGLYGFAKSAGVGFSQSLSNGFLSSYYPFVCEGYRNGRMEACIHQGVWGVLSISVLFALQAAIAPTYIDVLFDERWADAGLIVSILCLAAIPTLCIDTAGTIFRAKNKASLESLLTFCSVVTLGLGISLMRPDNVFDFALAVTLISASWLPILVVFRKVLWAKPLSPRDLSSAALQR